MRIVTRQILCELLQVAVLTCVVLAAMLTLGLAAKEGLRKGLPLGVILWTTPCFLVETLGYIIPGSVLFSVSAVYGRMSRSFEITALKSLGVNPFWVFAPALVMAYLASFLTTCTYDLAACWSRPEVQRIVSRSVAEIANNVLREEKSFASPWCRIMVSEVQGEKLVNAAIRVPKEDGPGETLITTDWAVLSSRDGGLLLTCANAEAEVSGSSVVLPGRTEVPVPLEDPTRPVHRDWLALSELEKHADQARWDEQRCRTELASCGCPVGRENLENHLQWCVHKQRRLAAEPHRRWANGFSCLCFALIGAPVAVMLRNSDVMTTFFAVFLPVLLCFYPLLMMSERLAVSGAAPPWAFWLGDGLLVVVGALLMRRTIRC
ncbi:MAG: LptF/LptG family permease [Planctomycetota bacterium]